VRKLGEEVEVGGVRYIVTRIGGDGRVTLTNIPEGMTARDLGTKFYGALMEHDAEAGRGQRAIGRVVIESAERPE